MLNKLLFTFFLTTTVIQASWSEYKSLYIAKDGRVIDRVNSNITHSEAVGYAMYLAVKNSDLKTFDKIREWYKNNLTRNKFGLISWKWGKDKDNLWHVLDVNNASDGDLWIAYDNLLMFEKTKKIEYKQEALAIVQSIKEHLIIKEHDMLYLLPAKMGFTTNHSIEINLSYYLFFIFDKFKQYDNDKIWTTLKEDGIKLLYQSRFTSLGLNADWIKIDKITGKTQYARNNSFGYDAIRIPFNILNSDIKDKGKLLEPYKNYVNAMKLSASIFGVTDLKDGNISLYNYGYVHLSIYNMLDKYFNKKQSFSKKLNKLKGENKDDYYSYSIYLFTTFS